MTDRPADVSAAEATPIPFLLAGGEPRGWLLRLAVLLTACCLPIALLGSLPEFTLEGRFHFYATVLRLSGLLGLLAGLVLILRFWVLGGRYHLVVGMAFFLGGFESLFNGLLSHTALMGIDMTHPRELIPANYVSGQLLFGLSLLLAAFVPDGGPRRVQSRRVDLYGIFLLMLTLLVLVAQLMKWSAQSAAADLNRWQPWIIVGDPGAVLARGPAPTPDAYRWRPWALADDGGEPLVGAGGAESVVRSEVGLLAVLALGLLLLAFALYVLRFRRRGEPLTWWLTVSIGLNAIGQTLMLAHHYLLGPLFLTAHLYKAAGFVAPLFGFLLMQSGLVLHYQRSQQALIAAREAAEAAAAAKSRFLTNVSHEIRTPMNGVLGLAERLGRTGLDERQRAYLRSLHASADHLMELLDEILDLAALESAPAPRPTRPTRLDELVADVLGTFTGSAEGRGLLLAADAAAVAGLTLRLDAGRVRQVLANLVGNAVKFTPAGRVRVSLRLCGPEAADGPRRFAGAGPFVLVTVADTGVGVEPAFVGRIFQPFAQGDTAERADGTGLGLALCRRHVEQTGGRIWLASEPGAGSRFHFTLPADQVASAVADGPVPGGMTSAGTAAGGTSRGGTSRGGTSRGGTSRGGTASERAVPGGTASGPAAHGGTASRPAAAGGADAATVTDAVAGDAAAAGQPAAALRILLAEDNEINRLVAVETLRELGHAVTVVETGAAAVAAAVRGSDDGPFDLVLMDMRMPTLDGPAACRRIRAADGLPATVPVVALTANAFAEHRRACRGAGMDGLLSKPLRTADLRLWLHWIARVRTPLADVGRLLRSVGGRAALIAELSDTLASQTRGIVARFRADDRPSAGELAGLVHRLGGGVGQFHAADLQAFCRELEHALRSGELSAAATTVRLEVLSFAAEALVRQLAAAPSADVSQPAAPARPNA